MAESLENAVSAYGASVKAKLANIAIEGAPEDQLRAPLEKLVHDLAIIGGLSAASIHMVGETTLAHLKTRPDFAVTAKNSLVGFLEVKAPGKGADPRRFDDPHDKEQWARLKSLPNLMYTDGKSFSLWRDGEIIGKIVELEGDLETSGIKLKSPQTLLPLITDFLTWSPIPPRNAKALAEISARLCQLLRDEVVEQLELGSEGLTALEQDWKKLLFPEADKAQFADGYAQAVTFGLLMARALDIPLNEGIDHAAQELRKTNSLIPSAPEPLPDVMEYEAATGRLRIGKGYVENVTSEMWAYEVSGKQVLRQWFSYRRLDRSRPIIGDSQATLASRQDSA